MEIHISNIFLFNEKGEERSLKFKNGLNIITGDSKTGKSAIIEIIDYCLFSSRSTIPKGTIDNWVNLFCVILKNKNKYIILGRPKNNNRTYFNIETNDDFLIDFNHHYFNNIELKPLKDNQLEFEKHTGISVLDTRIDEDDSKKNSGKVSMRSFISFLFQHQNLIANKHSLFYRFDDHYKRKKTIEHFPTLMGWGNSEYFMLKRDLEDKNKILKAEKKLNDKIKIDNKQLQKKLTPLIESYFLFIGKELNQDLSLTELKKIAKNLPNVTKKSFSDSELKLVYTKKIKNLEELKDKLDETTSLIDKLKVNSDLSYDYRHNLSKLKSFASMEDNLSNSSCPLCKNEIEEINNKISLVKESKEKLIEEFSKIGNYTNDASKQIEQLTKERDSFKKSISKLSNEINKINKQLSGINSNDSFYEKAYILKGATEANVNNLLELGKLSKTNPQSIQELQISIDILKNKLSGYNIEHQINKAEVILNDKMTEICNKLDFEKELTPGKLLFSFKDFSFKYQFNDKENILLTEMGSGSNWLAIHLSVFLGFLYLNSISEKSSIPSILILDQPSQVYFPTNYGKLNENEVDNKDDLKSKQDDNILQVKNIFKVLLDEIEIIYQKANYKPQIIVLEHADEKDFDEYIKYRWKKNGDKLI